MGWKNVKEHYRIEHIVQVTQEGICIGSPYIHNIIVVSQDGQVLKRYDERSNEDLLRYQREIDADPAKLQQLIEAPDSFAASIPVYTYDGGDILEKMCEEPGWPNVTHDGKAMYENRFSTDKPTVVQWAKQNAKSGVQVCEMAVDEARRQLAKRLEWLAQETANLEKLEANYPSVPPAAAPGNIVHAQEIPQ